eukprot:scaffold585671_cov46-Prasinocladus_malaysianus.AAC.1
MQVKCYLDSPPMEIPAGLVTGAWVEIFGCVRCVSKASQQVYLKAAAGTHLVVAAGPGQASCPHSGCSAGHSLRDPNVDWPVFLQRTTCQTNEDLGCLAARSSPGASLNLSCRIQSLLHLELRLDHDLQCVMQRLARPGHTAADFVQVSACVLVHDGTGTAECWLDGGDACEVFDSNVFWRSAWPLLVSSVLVGTTVEQAKTKLSRQVI